jgi:hypothetical protein
MALGQTTEYKKQAFFDRGCIQAREKHDEGATRRTGEHGGGETSGIRLHECRLDGRQGVHHGRQDLSCGPAPNLCADATVVGEQIHAVARTSGKSREQQGRVQRGIETGYVTDTSRRGAAGVQDDEDVTVPLGAPCAYCDGGLTCGSSPVDGAGVVAGHIRTQAVEFRALATGEDTGAAVELAESGEAGRQMLPAGEGRQDPNRPRDLVIPLPGGKSKRAERADGDAFGLAVAPPCRSQESGQPAAFARRDRKWVA